MTQLILVPVDRILLVMPDVQHMLEPAIARADGRWDMWSVVSMLLSGQMNLWIAVDKGKPVAAMVTRIIDYPKLRALALSFIGGRGALKIILSHEEEVVAWAREKGCAEIEGYDRGGWRRLLTHWKSSWTFITRKI